MTINAHARRGLRRLASAIALVLLAGPARAYAPEFAPSQVTPQSLTPQSLTPQSLRPDAGPAEGVPTPPAPAAQTPPGGAADIDVLIDAVAVEGGFAELAQATTALTDTVRGRRSSIARIYQLAGALEAAYAHAGFVLARVAVPPQHLRDHGTLRLVVIDGFIEAIDAEDAPAPVRAVIAARLAWLVGRRRLTLADLERRLLIAGDVVGVSLTSTLKPGTHSGGARLVVDAAWRPVTGSFGVDDRLPGTLGTWQLVGSIAANSPLGFGEQFYAAFGLGTHFSSDLAGTTPLWSGGAGAVIPLGNAGVTINPEYAHARTATPRAADVPESVGTFDRLAVRLYTPLIRTRVESLGLDGVLAYITQRSRAPDFSADLSLDRYTVIRLGPDLVATLPSGTQLAAEITVSRGLGGRRAGTSDVPLSRAGATPTFTKLGLHLHVTQPLPSGLRLALIGDGQVAPGEAMLQSEQLALDTEDAVSGFADGTFNADQGATLRAELSRPFDCRLDRIDAVLSPYGFGAIGHGTLAKPTRLDQPTINAASVGVGLRVGIEAGSGRVAPAVSLELARRFSNAPGERAGWRLGVGVVLAF